MKLRYKASALGTALFGAVTMMSVGCRSYSDVAAHYSNKHIKENNNQVTAQIPEASELGYILMALSDIGNTDNEMIDKGSPYYQEVMTYFGRFKDHKAVRMINRDLKQDPAIFTHLRNGLYAYRFNDRNRMVLKTDYRIDLNPIDMRVYTGAIENFMKDSKFRSFYKQHEAFYNDIIKQESAQLTMNAVSANMTKRYKSPFNSYQVIMSPLMKGYNSSVELDGRGFRECLIFAQTANQVLLYSANQGVARNAYND